MRSRYKKWAIEALNDNPEICLSLDDLSKNIDQFSCLEIGSGKGDFIIGIAKLRPEYNYLGVEKVGSVLGVTLKKIIELDIKNIKLCSNDIVKIFPLFKDNSLKHIYLNFSDPWPKKRHFKRRLTYLSFLNEYYRILKDDGDIIFKSDNDGLYEFTLEQVQLSSFKIEKNYENYEFDENNDVMSEYEKKFRSINKNIHYIKLTKRS